MCANIVKEFGFAFGFLRSCEHSNGVHHPRQLKWARKCLNVRLREWSDSWTIVISSKNIGKELSNNA